MSFDSITVAKATAFLNGSIMIIQHSLTSSVAVLLICHIYNACSAGVWTSLTRRIHWTLWPDLLRSDSTSHAGLHWPLRFIGGLGIFGGVLAVIANVVTPLGLSEGAPSLSRYQNTTAAYVADSSLIGAWTIKGAQNYGQACGRYNITAHYVPCPGHSNPHDWNIPASTIDIFNSTPFGPFQTQFRQSFQVLNFTVGHKSILESQILRDDIFAIEGLIVDLTDAPGIGLWNHSLPTLHRGGTWSQEILWLEPVTTCVNTNLTVDYQLYDIDTRGIIKYYNITDRGGFVNLSPDEPELIKNGQDVDLNAHARHGAFITNNLTMYSMNLAQETSYMGNTVLAEGLLLHGVMPGRMRFLSLAGIVNASTLEYYEASLSLQNDVEATVFPAAPKSTKSESTVRPPIRLDGDDPRLPDMATVWTQNVTLCASAVRMKMQNVTFAFDGKQDLRNLQISRKDTGVPVLWGVQKTLLPVSDIDLFWGRVADTYEENQSISTSRSEQLYVPAGRSIDGMVSTIDLGNPSSLALGIWKSLMVDYPATDVYSGLSSYAVLTKWQSIIGKDPINGPSHILNKVWTDRAANILTGSHTTRHIRAASYRPSTSYDFKYGVPFILLVSIWLPIILLAILILLSGRLKLSHIRHLLNETSVGRVVIGDSVLVPLKAEGEQGQVTTDDTGTDPSSSQGPAISSIDKMEPRLKTSAWMKAKGEALVAFGPIRPEFEVGNSDGGSPSNTDTIEMENPRSGFAVRREKLRVYLRELVKLERNGGA
ncbi:hypothetical protein FRC17_000294 [Serendipita sp. 399]|nr:hypothetical protein FRC17_000294 [Serendipita sp. 399]